MPAYPVRVQTGLLGPYRPAGQASPAGAGGAGRGRAGQQAQQPFADMNALTTKYLGNIPEVGIKTDPAQIYEASAGGMRQDLESALTQAGQQAIGAAATTGREMSDVVARYLPEALKGYGRAAADVAGTAAQLGAKAEVAKSELEQRRVGMAQEMARFEQAQQQQDKQFMAEMQHNWEMQEAQLANNLRVAEANARNDAQLQSARHTYQLGMERMRRQFAAESQKYQEAQQNARHVQRLQSAERWQAAELRERQEERKQRAGQFIAKTPAVQPKGKAAGTAAADVPTRLSPYATGWHGGGGPLTKEITPDILAKYGIKPGWTDYPSPARR